MYGRRENTNRGYNIKGIHFKFGKSCDVEGVVTTVGTVNRQFYQYSRPNTSFYCSPRTLWQFPRIITSLHSACKCTMFWLIRRERRFLKDDAYALLAYCLAWLLLHTRNERYLQVNTRFNSTATASPFASNHPISGSVGYSRALGRKI